MLIQVRVEDYLELMIEILITLVNISRGRE